MSRRRFRAVPPLRYDRHTHTLSLGDVRREWIARIASTGTSGGEYATWFEQGPGSSPGTWIDQGRQGPADGSLWELNGFTDAPTARVRFWRGPDGRYYFERRTCP